MQTIAHRQYHVGPTETITVTLTATNGCVVNFDLEGQTGLLNQGQPLTIQMAGSTRTLNLLANFSVNSGGTCTIAIQGSEGGSDTDTIDQGSFGVPVTNASYRFQ